MEEFFRDFHFLRPWYLLLLFLPLLFYWKFFAVSETSLPGRPSATNGCLIFACPGQFGAAPGGFISGLCRFCRRGLGTERSDLAEKGSSRFGAGKSGYAAFKYVDRHGGQRPYAQSPDPRQV